MDLITGDTIENPSGLDAMAVGQPTLIPGVQGKAIRLHTPEQYVRVSGPSHRQECFGDLDKCPNGRWRHNIFKLVPILNRVAQFFIIFSNLQLQMY